MQADFKALKEFEYRQGNIHLWVFKRSTSSRKFSAFFVRTDESLNEMFRKIIQGEIARIIEFAAYTHLAETNENSCLSTSVNGNEFKYLKEQIDRPEPEHAVRTIRDLKGAEGYVVKFIHGYQTIYAVKRSTSTWKTAYPKKFINMIFRNGELAVAEDNGFSIERNFDFYCINNSVFISSKRAFESAMRHRNAYIQAFSELQRNPTFLDLFTNLQPLINYVGNNSIQLRRMAAVEQKALYARPNFLRNLQRVSQLRNWNMNFDPVTARIIPCEQTARTILQVLLDHRLLSEVTDNTYDVPDAIQIN